jgi:uncharacterized protein (TIGR02145 family)
MLRCGKILTIILAISFGFAQEDARIMVEDTLAPQVTYFSTSPDTVDVTDSSATITMSLGAMDDISGLNYFQMRFTGPSGSQEKWVYFGFNGTVSDTVTTSVTIEEFSESGLWELQYGYGYDIVNNQVWYDENGLDSLGIQAHFFVISNQDTTNPQVTYFNASPDTIDVTDSSATITMSLGAMDDISGLNYFQMRFTGPSGSQGKWVYFGFNGTMSDTVTTSVTIEEFSESGLWELQYGYGYDIVNNQVWFYDTDLDTLGIDAQFFVINRNDDYSGPTWHVSTSGSDNTGDGSYDFPFASIQTAIDSSSDGDSILVAEGTYNVNDLTVSDKSLTLKGVYGRDFTILDGEDAHRILTVNNASTYTFNMSGFTVTDGDALSNSGYVMSVEGGMATFSDMILEDSGQNTGNTLFRGNDPDSTTFKNCIVRNNSAENAAGVGYATLKYCLVYGNSGWNNTNPVEECIVINCTIVNNGGGAGNSWTTGGATNSQIVNSIIRENGGAGQIYYYSGSTLTGVTYSNIEDGYTGTGNIDADPLFTDPDSGDFSLQAESPAIDAGDPNSDYDPDGTIADMGAYYYHQSAQPSNDNYSLSFDGVDDYVDIPNLVDGSTSLTIEAWFKYENTDTWRWIYGGGSDWVDVGASVASGGNTIRYHFKTTDGSFSNGDGSIQLSPYRWYHFAMTYDGSAVKGYIDGQLDFETSFSGSVETNQNQMIGAGYTNAGEFFKGNLDDVRIWGYDRSQSEIQDNMFDVDPASEIYLEGCWTFNEGTGDTTYGQSSNPHEAVIYGASWSTDVPDSSVSISPEPNLRVNWMESIYHVQPGDEIGDSIYVEIINVGEADASNFDVGFYISEDSIITTSDHLLTDGRVNVTFLASGDTTVIDLPTDVSVPNDLPDGIYYFSPIVDEFNVVQEYDESDNFWLHHMRIGDPDFSLSFDGVDDYVVIADDPSLNPSDAITVSAWIKPYSWDGNRRVLQKGAGDEFILEGEDSDHFEFVVNGQGYSVETVLPPLNVWTHVAGVYNGDYAFLYIDGQLQASTFIGQTLTTTTDPLYIGTKNETSPDTDHFNGLIDDVRLWGRALDESEILPNMYFEPNWDDDLRPIAFWPFHEGGGDSVYSWTENMHHGSINGASWSADVPDKPTGSINIEFTSVRPDSGYLWVGLWFPGSDIYNRGPDVGRDSIYVNFASQSMQTMLFNGLPDAEGYIVRSRFDAIDSPTNGPDDCDNGYDLEGITDPINIYLGGTVYSDLALDECSGPYEAGSSYFGTDFSRIRVWEGNPVNPDANQNAFAITGDQITVEAWVYLMNLPVGDGYDIVLRPFGGGEARGSYGLHLQYDEQGNPVWAFSISDTVSNIGYVSSSMVSQGSWTHVAGTYDGTSMKLYLDGNLQAEVQYTGTIGYGDTGFYIGGYLGGQDDFFHGIIRDVSIWDVSRPGASILIDLTTPPTGSEPNLQGYWPLNEFTEFNGNYPISEDHSPNENHLFVQGNVSMVDAAIGDPNILIEPWGNNYYQGNGVENEPFRFGPVVDGWPLTWSLSSAPSGMTIDANGHIDWTPSSNQDGTYIVYVHGSNSISSAQSELRIFVDEFPVDSREHNNNNVSYSVMNNGVLGADRGIGTGFQFNGEFGLYEGSLIIGQTDYQISGALYEREFATRSMMSERTSPFNGFDQAFQSDFDDSRVQNPIGVHVFQNSYSKSNAPDNDYVIMDYELMNTSGQDLTGIYIGLAMDWDVGDYLNNSGGFDPDRNLSYVYETSTGPNRVQRSEDEGMLKKRNSTDRNARTSPTYFGVSALTDSVSGHYIQIGQFDSTYFYLMTHIESQDSVGDARAYLSVGPFDIPAYDTISTMFAVLGGENLADLQANADAAKMAVMSSGPVISVYPDSLNFTVFPPENEQSQTLTIENTGNAPLEVQISTGTLPVTDIDGNVYQTIQIGDQVWMAENLKVTKFRDGTDIPTGYNNTDWSNLSTGAYAVYNDDETNADTYGYLYNWYAVDDSRIIAPEGWHVSTNDEWTELTNYLGFNAGSILAGNADLWTDGNLKNNAEFGSSDFMALPGGYRSGYIDNYNSLGMNGKFWTSTEDYNANNGFSWYLNYSQSSVIYSASGKSYGQSVRCVQDQTAVTAVVVSSQREIAKDKSGVSTTNTQFPIPNTRTSRTDWLTLSADTLTIQPGTSADVTVTVNAAGLDPGDYSDNIMITSNDSTNSSVNIPVNMSVLYSGPSTWHISTDGDDAAGDGSAELPFASIQHGIDMANDGDSILVDSGDFNENIFMGKDLVLKSLYGPQITSIIHSSVDYALVTFYGGGNSNLSGFSLKNGNRTGQGGSAIDIYSSVTDVFIDNCILENNVAQSADAWGGTILVHGDSVSSNIKISNSILRNNTNSNGCSAIRIGDNLDPVKIVNTLIADNDGPAVHLNNGKINMVNCTIVGQSDNPDVFILNSNSYGLLINSIYANAAQGPEVTNNSLLDVVYSNIEGGWTGAGNIDFNPLFSDTANGDYRLSDSSSCIGAGIDSIEIAGIWYVAPDYDLDNNSRPNPENSNPDIGAYENPLGITSNNAPSVSLNMTLEEQHGFVLFNIDMSDPDGDELNAVLYFSTDSSNWIEASAQPIGASKSEPSNDQTKSLAMGGIDLPQNSRSSSRSWMSWDSQYDLGDVMVNDVWLKAEVNDGFIAVNGFLGPFAVDNHIGTVVFYNPPTEEISGEVEVNYLISDSTNDEYNMTVSYSADGGSSWMEPTLINPISDPLTPSDYSGNFTWNTTTDLANYDGQILLALSLSDGWEYGNADTIDFTVDNQDLINLVSYSPDTSALLNWYDSFLLFFPGELDQSTVDSGITLSGSISGPISVSTNIMTIGSQVRVSLIPDDNFYAGETVTLIISTQLKDTLGNPYDGNMNGDQDDDLDITILEYDTPYLADYDNSALVDFSDLLAFQQAWWEPTNYGERETGPAEGTAPNLRIVPDGKIDFEDLMVFVQMWNWSAGFIPNDGWMTNARTTENSGISVETTFPKKQVGVEVESLYLNINVDSLARVGAGELLIAYDPLALEFKNAVAAQHANWIVLASASETEGILRINLADFSTDLTLGSALASIEFRTLQDVETSINWQADIRDRSGMIWEKASGQTDFSTVPPLPIVFALHQNFPNPFNPTTTVRYDLPEDSRVRLTVYDIQGREVTIISNDIQPAGFRSIIWNGRDSHGRSVAAGMYFLRLDTPSYHDTRKMILLK